MKELRRNVLWILSPAYMDVESFLILRANILAVLHKQKNIQIDKVTFVVVDDTAGCDSKVQELACLKNVHLVIPPFSLGHQRAIVFGLRKILKEVKDNDIVVTMDADGEDSPEDLPHIINTLLSAQSKWNTVVLAQRTKRKVSLSFRVMYVLFKVAFKLLTGLIIQSGNYACYRGAFLRQLIFHPHFDLCYSSTFLSLNLPISYVPCERRARYVGQSRMNFLKLIQHGVSMLTPFIARIAVRALVFFSITLGTSSGLCLMIFAWRGASGHSIDPLTGFFLLLGIQLSLIVLGNFIILFMLFSQSQGILLKGLDQKANI